LILKQWHISNPFWKRYCDDGQIDKIPSVAALPALVDEEKVVQGSTPTIARLAEIEKFTERWDKLQSDACSCDEEALE
jgi:hypothetical protein